MKSAYLDDKGEWVYPQVYYLEDKKISKKRLVQTVDDWDDVQEVLALSPHAKPLLEKAKKQKCVYGYNRIHTYENEYKHQIEGLLGPWYRYLLRSFTHAINSLLPADEVDLYPDGIMPNGYYSPKLQEKYGTEYP